MSDVELEQSDALRHHGTHGAEFTDNDVLETGPLARTPFDVQQQASSTSMLLDEPPRSLHDDPFLNLIRATQFISTHGMPKSLLPHLCYLITQAGGDVGGSNHSKRFCSIVEHQADKLLLQATNALLSKPMGATHVLPDVCLILDGGTIGKYYAQARGTVLLVGLIIPIEEPPFTAAILAGIVESLDGSRHAVLKDLQKVFSTLAVPNFEYWLKSVWR